MTGNGNRTTYNKRYVIEGMVYDGFRVPKLLSMINSKTQ